MKSNSSDKERRGMPARIEELFCRLNEAGIFYCLLRGRDELFTEGRYSEIDLLVARESLGLLETGLRETGFARLPAWGHAPHRFYVRYDRESGTWLKLDVVDELRYGHPIRCLGEKRASECLERRSQQELTYVLAAEDEFVTLLLHCLLDKRGFAEKHRMRLEELWQEYRENPQADERVTKEVNRYLAPAITRELLDHTIPEHKWEAILNCREALSAQLFRRNPLRSLVRRTWAGFVRRLRPVLFALFHRGIAVALAAPDGAGKTTVGSLLEQDLFLRARTIHMGWNRAARAEAWGFGGSWKDGRPPRRGLRFLSRLVSQWSRFLRARYETLRGSCVIFDRYVYDLWLRPRTSNWAEQMRLQILRWGWPRVDLAILLDAPGQLLYQRKMEHTVEWLEEKRQAYRSLPPKVPQMRVVDASGTPEAVLREVTGLIWEQLQKDGARVADKAWIHGAMRPAWLLALLLAVAAVGGWYAAARISAIVRVAAVAETEPVPSQGDAADDAAIWVNPADPAQSLIIGTDKDRGLGLYDLNGRQLQFLHDGRLNNVDLRSGFFLKGRLVSLVTAGNRTDYRIAIYAIDETTKRLEPVAARVITTVQAYGSCMYHSRETGKFYYIVNSMKGEVEQWELFATPEQKVDGKLVRRFAVGSRTEGCVADDQHGYLYLALEDVGIWKFWAEPNAGYTHVVVDTTGPDGHLSANDVEGLALYTRSDGSGYLIASNQGEDNFVVYRRRSNNAYLGEFEIVDGEGTDEVTLTDGIAVTSASLGPRFSKGLFVAQDGENDGQNQNFKLVSWAAVEDALEHRGRKRVAVLRR